MEAGDEGVAEEEEEDYGDGEREGEGEEPAVENDCCGAEEDCWDPVSGA